MKHIGEIEGMALLTLNLGTRWRWVVSFTLRPLYPRNRTPMPIEWEAWLAEEPVWTLWRREKSLAGVEEMLKKVS